MSEEDNASRINTGASRIKIRESIMNSEYYKNHEDIHFVQTTLKQERELFEKARNGDAESRNFLIKNHLLFAANKARAITKSRIPDEEVISAVNEALVKAVDAFDYTRGVRFTCYLFPVIKGVISRLWEEERKKAHVELSDADSLEPAESPAEACERKESGELLLKALDGAKDRLTKKEKDLLMNYYTDGMSFADIGRQNGITRAAVQAHHSRIIEKLRKWMKGARE
jgi:RNA polymerase sigma factor (sigma-70 family)